jgi:hypothetical protein
MKTVLTSAALAAALAVGGLAASAGTASAAIVCNASGDCWHVDNRREHYPRDVRAVYHNDDWYFHQKWDDKRRWREAHEGRGYWANGVWVERRR